MPDVQTTTYYLGELSYFTNKFHPNNRCETKLGKTLPAKLTNAGKKKNTKKRSVVRLGGLFLLSFLGAPILEKTRPSRSPMENPMGKSPGEDF